ncbi:MAG: adaptor protein MecA [Lachnospiraceae bacterium]|nr:adaptor protein MecA [Lachnospiraceae bacterium]
MKIEKVNDRQIRCTLSKQELEQRDLKLTEIAYGNAKVKALFSDMMRQASLQFGFEAEDIPLMIEVIPFAEYVMVQVTKVEDPDELDTRFSRFAPSVHNESREGGGLEDMLGPVLEDGLKDVLKKIGELKNVLPNDDKKTEEEPAKDEAVKCFYRFDSLGRIIRAAEILKVDFELTNVLYKNSEDGSFMLRLEKEELADSVFLKICSVLSEYGNIVADNGFLSYFVNEHCEVIVADNALKALAAV